MVKHEHNILADIPGVYPISSYLSYWKDHISIVLNNVPEDRLLIIDTFEIKDKISDISSFLGIHEENLNKSKFWSGKKKPSLKLYELIEKEKILRQIEDHCGDYIKAQVPFLLKYLLFLS